MHLFNRDEVERKREEYPRRHAEAEKQIRDYHWYAVNRKKGDDPNRRAAEINVLRFSQRPH